MKITIMLLAGLSIGAVMAIAAVQLIKTLIHEVGEIFTEAWNSPEPR